MGDKKQIIESETVSGKELTTSASSAEALIAQAIEKGTSVETMEKLLAMRQELKAEWAKEQFDKSMADFQMECPIIDKDGSAGTGSGFTYKYATLAHIVNQVKELLARNGFSYTFDSKKTENALITYCHVKHKAGHSETSQFEIAIDTGARMNISQKDGAASSYGKRYAFCNAFGILTGDEDTDVSPAAAKTEVSGGKPAITVQYDTDNGNGNGNGDYKASVKQQDYIRGLLSQKGYKESQLLQKCEISNLSELTREQASDIIGRLQKLEPRKKVEKASEEEAVILTDEDYQEIEKGL